MEILIKIKKDDKEIELTLKELDELIKIKDKAVYGNPLSVPFDPIITRDSTGDTDWNSRYTTGTAKMPEGSLSNCTTMKDTDLVTETK